MLLEFESLQYNHHHALCMSSASSRLVSSSFFIFHNILPESFSSRLKQHERQERIKALAPIFHEPISAKDQHVMGQPISALVSEVQNGQRDPVDILTAYGKKALQAHKETNCLTEVMIASAIGWAKDCNRTGPLAGVPVSLKDVSTAFITNESPFD